MNPAFFTVVLLLLILVLTFQTIFTANRDLYRARAWGELGRRIMPFVALLLMAGSLPFIRITGGETTVVWLVVFGIIVAGASLFAVPFKERRANRAFRRGDYDEAIMLFREMIESNPLPRNYAFLGAALGAAEQYDESVKVSTTAVEKDPDYGLAYYNRALIQLRMNRKEKAKQDLARSLEADLPRRFRRPVQNKLEELGGK